MNNYMNIEKIKELEKQIEDIKARWPAHSVSPDMYRSLEELEEELAKEKNS